MNATLSDKQWQAYMILLGMNNNGPLTDENRALMMTVDLTPVDITKEDKEVAIRWYEYIVGTTLKV